MDPEIHLSEGHRSGMLLDLSGLTREERVMVQASISSERDFDRVAEALIIQHPRIHLRESQRRAKGKGNDEFKRVDNSNTRWFRGRGKGKHTGSGESGASAHHANLTSVEDYDDFDEERVNLLTPVKPTMAQLTPEAMTEKKLRTMMMTTKTTRFIRMLLWTMSQFSRQLNWTRVLFLPTWSEDLDPEASAQLVQASAPSILFFWKVKRQR